MCTIGIAISVEEQGNNSCFMVSNKENIKYRKDCKHCNSLRFFSMISRTYLLLQCSSLPPSDCNCWGASRAENSHGKNRKTFPKTPPHPHFQTHPTPLPKAPPRTLGCQNRRVNTLKCLRMRNRVIMPQVRKSEILT